MSNVNAVGGSAPVYAPPLGAEGDSLTPDTLLLYCASQLHGMDDQIKSSMAAQKATRDAQAKITQLKQDLAAYTTGGIKEWDWQKKEQVLGELKAIYDTLPAGDPSRQSIQAAFNKFRSSASCMNDNGNTVSLDTYTPDKVDFDAKVGWDKPENSVDGQEVKDLMDGLDGASGDIGKNADIAMISLQSLVSQRQMAVQIATNLINKVNETTAAVVQNIK